MKIEFNEQFINIANKERDLMENIFQCDECKSGNLELIKRETKQKWDNYYMEMEYFDVLTLNVKIVDVKQ